MECGCGVDSPEQIPVFSLGNRGPPSTTHLQRENALPRKVVGSALGTGDRFM